MKQTTSPTPPHPPLDDALPPLEPTPAARLLPTVFAIAFGMAITLCLRGYQFGHSNHAVYLLDAMRIVSPELLANDWFTTETLQYHALFGWMTHSLWRLNLLEPAFLIGYLALAFFLHLGWYRLVFALGGSQATYLLSVLFFYLSAGGIGLGMYQFLQDGAFLPSNVASVAMLWGIYFWIAGKFGRSGLLLGAAGLFHLNHAVVAIGLFFALSVWRLRDTSPPSLRRSVASSLVPGATAVLTLCSLNILLALRAIAEHTAAIPLDEFIDLYVRLRHGHHYDPSMWPAALWLCFLWPVPLAVLAARHASSSSVRQAVRVYLLFSALIAVALIGAGLWYVSESLVQMSLYRFSVYVLLLGCIAAAWLLHDAKALAPRTLIILVLSIPILLAIALILLLAHPFESGPLAAAAHFASDHAGPIVLFILLSTPAPIHLISIHNPTSKIQHPTSNLAATLLILALLLFAWNDHLGLGVVPEDDDDYLALCDWARDPRNTPIDAVFLVPPDEHAFRLHGQRAIVINFKGVPQLSGEIPEWRDRLQHVLETDDLRRLPRPFHQTLAAIRDRYAGRSTDHLIAVAGRYHARYIVAVRPLDPGLDDRLVFRSENNRYFLYDLEK